MIHDPLCPDAQYDLPCMSCDLIARVRADDAAQWLVTDREQQEREQAAYDKGVRDERERAAERVKALYGSANFAYVTAAVAAARGGAA